jgi:hypothetical protein
MVWYHSCIKIADDVVEHNDGEREMCFSFEKKRRNILFLVIMTVRYRKDSIKILRENLHSHDICSKEKSDVLTIESMSLSYLFSVIECEHLNTQILMLI